MKKYNIKLKKIIILTVVFTCLLLTNSYSHSGRTDSNGGHRDNKNKSGLGSYHYHCGGHPAHLHPNGICPYSSNSSSSSTSEININENTKTQNNDKIITSKNNNEIVNKNIVNKDDDSSAFGEIIMFGLLCGGGYLGYKKYKKD